MSKTAKMRHTIHTVSEKENSLMIFVVNPFLIEICGYFKDCFFFVSLKRFKIENNQNMRGKSSKGI